MSQNRPDKWRIVRSPFGGFNVLSTVGSQVIGQFATCVTLANAKAIRSAQQQLQDWVLGGKQGERPCRVPDPVYVPAARQRWLESLLSES